MAKDIPDNVQPASPSTLSQEAAPPITDLEEPRGDSVATAPIGPTLDLSSVVSETENILETYRNFLSERKTKQAMATYYLHKLSTALAEYSNFENKLENFFSQHDVITSEIYLQHCTNLPVYGDYGKVLKDSQHSMKLRNVSSAIPEIDVRRAIMAVVENVFAGGNYTRTMHKICQNITSSVVERRRVVQEVRTNFPFWFDLLDKQAANNSTQTDDMFETLSFINFMKSGMDAEPLQLKIPNYGDFPAEE